MLRELTRADWLSILALPADRIPHALLLRGTRNLRTHYRAFGRHFTNVTEVGLPNGIVEDVFIGDLDGRPVAYASVYGAAMASEIVHIFGVLGTSLVVLTGCCGALADAIGPGDLVLTTEAFCGEGASQYYKSDGAIVCARSHPDTLGVAERVSDLPVHLGRMFTTGALLAEGEREIEAWHADGWSAVDMETATVFAVAEHFGMDRLAIHFAFDNPRRKRHIFLGDEEETVRRSRGNARMIELALELVRCKQ